MKKFGKRFGKELWISVCDAFPETEQSVIIRFENNAGWHVGTCYWDGMFFSDLCEECGYWERYDTVSHWMPLPVWDDVESDIHGVNDGLRFVTFKLK